MKEQRLWTSLLNGIEDALFAQPSTAEMEAQAGTKPYSIPCFLNEYTNGLFAEDDGTTIWSTVEGIDPTVKTKWKPKQATYQYDKPGTTAADSNSVGIMAAFDNMYLSVKFSAPPTRTEYFENDSLYRQFIACSKFGMTTYSQILRLQQDRFAAPSMQDPAFLKPTYGGIEVEYVAALDTAPLYAPNSGNINVSEGTTHTEGGGTDADFEGPRYYWVNANYMLPVFHSKRYMARHPVMTHPNQPFTHVQPVDCWMNMICRSRQRQGIVSPATAFAGA